LGSRERARLHTRAVEAVALWSGAFGQPTHIADRDRRVSIDLDCLHSVTIAIEFEYRDVFTEVALPRRAARLSAVCTSAVEAQACDCRHSGKLFLARVLGRACPDAVDEMEREGMSFVAVQNDCEGITALCARQGFYLDSEWTLGMGRGANDGDEDTAEEYTLH